MSHAREWTRCLLAAMVVLATGCARAPMPLGAPTVGSAPAARAFSHKLGYDLDRYHDVIARTERPQTMPRQGALPPRADLRAFCPPVYDQGDLGACTAFAIAKGLRETLERQRGEATTPLSAMFFYYVERTLTKKITEDAGATIADGMSVLAHTGAAPESDWPFKPAQFTVKPPSQAFADAPRWKVKKTYHLAKLEDVKTALANRYTVAMGFECYTSFDDIGKSGMMPMPKAGEKMEGGHASLVVGYDEARKVLIVRNSWGADWGDKGYFYMPYAYAESKAVDEFWTAQ